MKVLRFALVAAAIGVVGPAVLSALDTDIDDADIRRAGAIALGTEVARDRFHHLYEIASTDAAIERLEIITEFRRYVMESERQIALGNWMVVRGGYDSSGRTLKDLLKEFRGRAAVRAQIRLHPLHTYSALPPVDIVLGTPPLLPLGAVVTPITRGSREEGTQLLGAIVEHTFNAPSIGNATLPLTILVDGHAVARAQIEFSRLD